MKQQLPLTGSQSGIWYADLLAEQQNRFAVAQLVKISGEINLAVLKRSICQTLMQADTVQYAFNQQDSDISQTPQQLSLSEIEQWVQILDLSEQQAKQVLKHDIEQDHSVASGNISCKHLLIRVEQQVYWYSRYHHLMLDGYSFSSLTRQISLNYQALSAQKPLLTWDLTPFSQVIAEEQAYEKSDKFQQDKNFWADYCQDLPQAPQIYAGKITDNNTQQESAYQQVHRQNLSLEAQQVEQLHSLAKQLKCSAADVVSAAIFVYLHKVSKQNAICVGYPLMRRLGSVAINSLGTTANVLPLKLTIDPQASFVQLTKDLIGQLRQIKRHQKYDAEQIQRDLGLTGSQAQLYGPMLNCKVFETALAFDNCQISSEQIATGPIDDCEFAIYASRQNIALEISLNSQKYPAATANLHLSRIQLLLKQICLDAQQNIQQLNFVTLAERSQIAEYSQGKLLAVNALQQKYGNNCLDLLVKQLEQQADSIALRCFAPHLQQLSYAQLAIAAQQIANQLQTQGVNQHSVIAVALPRGLSSLVSILAIFSLGATYVPLDLNYPAERLQVICDDAQPTFILCQQQFSQSLSNDYSHFFIEDDVICDLTQPAQTQIDQVTGYFKQAAAAIVHKQRAYIFYTSGSTGKPKGVMVPHASLLNLAAAMDDEIYPDANSRLNTGKSRLNVTLTGSFSFDTSWDPVLLMLLGHRLDIVLDQTKQDMQQLIEYLSIEQIDVMALAPSLATQLIDAGLFTQAEYFPKLWNICGEAILPQLWHKLQKLAADPAIGLNAYNIYGPTEFTVYATYAKVCQQRPVPSIGYPMLNTQSYILDEQLQTAAIGVAGELYLAGDNMTLGYLNRPEVTSSRFVANPFATGQVMYATGDLVYWNLNGEIEFIGRCDNQVKVRGHRIELGEVEAALSSLKQIKETAVTCISSPSGNQLAAYATLHKTLPQTLETKSQLIKSLQAELAQSLPSYMLPASLTLLTEFPLTVSGKLNKQALPKPEILQQNQYIAAETAAEKALLTSLENVLARERIGMLDDFFDLGGDSISAMQLSQGLKQQNWQLKVKDIFASRQLNKMAQCMLAISETDTQVTAPAQLSTEQRAQLNEAQNQANIQYQANKHKLAADAISAVLPCLPLQTGLYFQSQLNSVHGYTFSTQLYFSQAPDADILQQALNLTLQQYPQLAAYFALDQQGQACQIIPNLADGHSANWPMQVSNFTLLTAEQAQARQQQLIYQMATAKFDPAKSLAHQQAMLNAHLILNGEQSVLIVSTHHLVIDGWSLPVCLKALQQNYQSLLQAQPVQAECFASSYQALVEHIHHSDKALALDHWQAYLADCQPCLLYPGHNEVAQINELDFQIDEHTTAQLNQLASQAGVTLGNLLQTAWATLLSQLTSSEQVLFARPVSGRSQGYASQFDINNQVGLFSNTLPVKVKLNPSQSLLANAQQMQLEQAELLEFDYVGLTDIQPLNKNCQFDTLFVVENYPFDKKAEQNNHALQIKHVENKGFTHFPLTILVLPGEQIRILFEYQNNVSNAPAIAERFVQLLNNLPKQVATELAQLDLRATDEKHLIHAVNQTAYATKADNLLTLLSAAANEHAAQTALIDIQQQLSYQQMQQKVAQLQQAISSKISVKPGQIIAVCLPRSVELSLALQAVIYSGAAYLPLDSEYPQDRLNLMLEDANAALLITNNQTCEQFSHLNISQLNLDTLSTVNTVIEIEQAAVSSADPAYVIYTSGSTGKPKGVVVSHGAIANRLLWMQHMYPIGVSDNVLQKTPASFDVSVWEFFWPLMQGSTLVMAPPVAHKDPQQLRQLIDDYKITTLHFVPSMLDVFVQHLFSETQDSTSAHCPSIKQVFCSGEALKSQTVNQYEQVLTAPLHNLYGPTEAAVDVSYFQANASHNTYLTSLQSVPIGKPTWNTQLHVLDHWLRPVGINCIGELYLAGVQLANGYLNRPALTADRFVANPFLTDSDNSAELMYRTGDMVRYLADGQIEYLGRCDDQLKIRGQRIEYGELEQAICQLPGIKQAAVHARVLNKAAKNSTADARQLVGYYVATDATANSLNSEQMLTSLAEFLPAHMLPIALVAVSSLPMSANGKLDRKALPDPQLAGNSAGRKPSSGIETDIAESYADVLQINAIELTADDDFFSLGGHSLLAMQLAAKLSEKLTFQVSVGQILVSPAINELAAVLQDDALRNDPTKAGFGQILPIRPRGQKSLICINPGSGFAWQYTQLSQHLDKQWRIVGLQSPRPMGAMASSGDMQNALTQYLDLLKQVQPQGPYYLCGYSFGGTVAQSLAAMLQQQGEEVALLALFDTYPPEGQKWKKPTDAEAQQEVEREKRQFFAATEQAFANEEARAIQQQMFSDIVANYADAVRLLSKAQSLSYQGTAHLFVAEKTVPADYVIEQHWQPFIQNLQQYKYAYSHDDILSAQALLELGPRLNELLNSKI